MWTLKPMFHILNVDTGFSGKYSNNSNNLDFVLQVSFDKLGRI